MKAGQLRHRVRLQNSAKVRSETGQQIDVWQDYGSIWMGIEPLSARMRIQANQVMADITHKGTIRFHRTIAPGHRAVKDDRTLGRERTFEIVSVVDVGERRAAMELMMIETQP